MNGINTIGQINGSKYQSQNDPKWKNLLMAGSNLTIGNYGCAATCVSMLTEYYGCYQTPQQIAQNQKFNGGGSMNWINLDFPTFSFRWSDGNIFNTNQSVINQGCLKYYLSDAQNGDKSCIIQITVTPYKGGQPYTHFVVGLWFDTEKNDIYIIDPWDGKSKYLQLSYPTGKITEVCYFTRWDKTKNNNKQAWQGAKQPVAPLYN